MLLGLGTRGGPIGGARLALKLVNTLVERRPLFAQIDVTLSESTETLIERVKELHRLGTFHIRLGGDPLAHPGIHDVIGHAARRSQVSITANGFRLWVAAARRG